MLGKATLLETAFPYVDVSRLVAADRRSPDPAYQAHRWWARRPPAILRAALLAAALPASTSTEDFWAAYRSEGRPLTGLAVVDPFLGGGTTLVEGARLGARMRGRDVDPLAVLLSEHQLAPPPASDVLAAGEMLGRHLDATIGDLWAVSVDSDGGRWHPLHYFSIATVTCPKCEEPGRLYRSLVIARSVGKAGAVVRDVEVTAFCPDCLALHHLGGDRKTLTCCSRRHRLDQATFSRTRYTCRECGQRSTHEQLQTGTAPRTVIAVEETPAPALESDLEQAPRSMGQRRRIREQRPSDAAALARAESLTPPERFRKQVSMPLVSGSNDRRPLSYGIRRVADLHTSRQIAYLTEALLWLESAGLEPAVQRALRLAVSTTITCNNRLCGYATDYGRLSPLFSVRAFSLPSLTVELNPLNPTGGRGTLSAAVARVAQSCDDEVRRHVIAEKGGKGAVRAEALHLPRVRQGHSLTCTDSTDESTEIAARHTDKLTDEVGERDLADVCVTDPPYFDFIPYDTLSQVFRVWLTGHSQLAGSPLLPGETDPVAGFGTSLGVALRTALRECKPEALVAFTYKGGEAAWSAVGIALDEAKLSVTALWPVLADPHMGHHTHEGNCEYDVLVIARPFDAVQPAPQSDDDVRAAVTAQVGALRAVRAVSPADELNLTVATRMASTRRGTTSCED